MARDALAGRQGGRAAATLPPFGAARPTGLAASLLIAGALAACGPRVRSAPEAPPPDPPPPAALDAPCPADCGDLTLRFVLGDAGPFTSLVVQPYWGGANADRSRRLGWTGFTGRSEAVVLHPRVPVVVASGALPAGAWHRAFAAAKAVHGRLRSGRRVRLANHIEPIARGFDLAPGARATVDLELIVLDAPGDGDAYGVFVRDARLVDAPHAPHAP